MGSSSSSSSSSIRATSANATLPVPCNDITVVSILHLMHRYVVTSMVAKVANNRDSSSSNSRGSSKAGGSRAATGAAGAASAGGSRGSSRCSGSNSSAEWRNLTEIEHSMSWPANVFPHLIDRSLEIDDPLSIDATEHARCPPPNIAHGTSPLVPARTSRVSPSPPTLPPNTHILFFPCGEYRRTSQFRYDIIWEPALCCQ